jgi:hypothetical protein
MREGEIRKYERNKNEERIEETKESKTDMALHIRQARNACLPAQYPVAAASCHVAYFCIMLRLQCIIIQN